MSVDALEVFQEALNLALVKPADTQPFFQGGEVGGRLPTGCFAFSRVGETLVAAAERRPGDTVGGVSGAVGGGGSRKVGFGVVVVVLVAVLTAI